MTLVAVLLLRLCGVPQLDVQGNSSQALARGPKRHASPHWLEWGDSTLSISIFHLVSLQPRSTDSNTALGYMTMRLFERLSDSPSRFSHWHRRLPLH